MQIAVLIIFLNITSSLDVSFVDTIDDSKSMTAQHCHLKEEGLKISATPSFKTLDLSKIITHFNSHEILDNTILKDVETLDVAKARKHFIVQKGRPVCYFEFFPYSDVMSREIILIKGSFNAIEGKIRASTKDTYILYEWQEDGRLKLKQFNSPLGQKTP